MGKILAVAFLVIAGVAAYGIKVYLPVLKGQPVAEAAADNKPEPPKVGFEKVAPAASVDCTTQSGRKICKVAKPAE